MYEGVCLYGDLLVGGLDRRSDVGLCSDIMLVSVEHIERLH